MKYSTIGYILGQVLKFEGIFMLLPFLTEDLSLKTKRILTLL